MTSTAPTAPIPRVALLGLGLMGTGMARRLVGAGIPLTVYNRTKEKATTLVAEGALLAATPREAVADADFVFSVVSDDNASRAVWLGADGAIAGAKRGTILIESSTLNTEWITQLARAAAAKGCELLDAPVTGSKVAAAAGELTFLVGGPAAALERARSVMDVMGRAVVHIGASGTGSLVKLISNFLIGVQAASLGQALALIERSELDRDVAMAVLTNGAVGSPLVKTLSLRMTAREYAPNFHLSLMAKDLTYALGEAKRRGIDFSLGTAALEAFTKAAAAGHGHRDFSAVFEPMHRDLPK